MQGVIVSDTSCLILFNKIGRLDILKSVFGKIIITSIIAKEKGILKSVQDIIELIRKTDFRISERLIIETLKRCGE